VANKISVLIDVVTDTAVGSLKKFKQGITDAEGASGKLKAGFSGAGDAIKANAGSIATVAGGAIVAFGIKALGAFQDMAQGAKQLSTASGLAVEDASRWRAVADDFGVTGEAVGKAVGKITKSLDAATWKEFGVATRDAAGHARNMNDILLDSLDALAKIQNPTERAAAGVKMFGKAYADISPLIGKTRGEYEKLLGAVDNGQVITKSELQTSENMRRAQDDLHDALQQVTLAVGGVVAQGAR
jgi:hypothetical protein